MRWDLEGDSFEIRLYTGDGIRYWWVKAYRWELTIVWISPVVANIEGQTFDGGAYHGESLYAVLKHRNTDLIGYWMSDLTSECPCGDWATA